MSRVTAAEMAELPLELVRRMLEPLGDEGRVTGVRVLKGGGISAVHLARRQAPARHREVVIKVYPEEYGWKLDKEVYVYGLLGRLPSVPVPRVLASDRSRTLLPACYLVLTRLPGRMLGDVGPGLPSDEIARVYEQLGTHLRTIHRLTVDRFGYLCTGVVDPHGSNRAYMGFQFAKKLAEFRRAGGPDGLAGRVERFVADRADALDVCRVARLCHDDVYENNVLVEPDAAGRWRLTGLLDVENAVAGDPLIDLAKTWLYATRASDHRWHALLTGYGDLGGLARERLELYRLYHAVELWDWFAAIGDTAPLGGLLADIEGFVTGSAPSIEVA